MIISSGKSENFGSTWKPADRFLQKWGPKNLTVYCIVRYTDLELSRNSWLSITNFNVCISCFRECQTVADLIFSLLEENSWLSQTSSRTISLDSIIMEKFKIEKTSIRSCVLEVVKHAFVKTASSKYSICRRRLLNERLLSCLSLVNALPVQALTARLAELYSDIHAFTLLVTGCRPFHKTF